MAGLSEPNFLQALLHILLDIVDFMHRILAFIVSPESPVPILLSDVQISFYRALQ